MGFIGRASFWTFHLTFGFLCLAGIIALPGTQLSSFQFAPSIVILPAYLAAGFGITAAACLPFLTVCWIDKAFAELFAFSKIGRSKY